MKLLLVLLCLLPGYLLAQSDTLTKAEIERYRKLPWELGSVSIADSIATLSVPPRYVFLNAKDAQFVINRIWNNPINESIVGLVAIDSGGLDWGFVIYWIPEGYVSDEEAKDINEDGELLKMMQESQAESNAERIKEGYELIILNGWARPPYYDEEKKVIHWAKDYSSENVQYINYNLLFLGRRGYIRFNGVGTAKYLPEMEKAIANLHNQLKFNKGERYQDFDSSIDEVAAYGIGGLIAGKVLAKVGFFAILAKFSKVIIITIVAGATAAWQIITGRRKLVKQKAIAEVNDSVNE